MFHIPAAIHLHGLESVCVAEFSETQRAKLGSTFPNLRVYPDYQQELQDATFAILATPPHTHIEIMRECVATQVPFLCEKPVAFSSGELQEIIDATETRKIVAGVCHTYRFFPNRLELRRLVKDGFFGESPEFEILEGDPTTWSPVSGYNFRKEITPGGVFLDGGIHSLDFLVWCLGVPTSVEYYDDSLGGLESNLRLSLLFPTSAKAFFRISRTCSLPNTIRVMGNGHVVEAGIFDFNNLIMDGKHISIAGKYPGEASDWSDIAQTQLSNFINAVQAGLLPRCSLEEASKTISIIEESYSQKSQRQKPVSLPLPGLTF